MRILKVVLVALSFIILAAHFLRSGDLILTLAILLVPALLLVRRTWAVRLVQLVLVLGAIEWVRTTMGYIQERQALGQSWERLVMILGLVALLTLAAAFVLQPRAARA